MLVVLPQVFHIYSSSLKSYTLQLKP